MPDYTKYVELVKQGRHKVLPGFDYVIEAVRGKKIVDLGCGGGNYLELLGEFAVGLEREPELGELCIRKGLRVINADLSSPLPILDGYFEAALFSHVLEHLERPFDALREVHRILGPRGILVLGLPTESNFIRSVLRMDYYNGTHLMAFSVRGARRILQLTGFTPMRLIFGNPRMDYRILRSLLPLVQYLPGREWLSMYYWIIAERDG